MSYCYGPGTLALMSMHSVTPSKMSPPDVASSHAWLTPSTNSALMAEAYSLVSWDLFTSSASLALMTLILQLVAGKLYI